MPEQLIDTRFPGQQLPVGSVVTLLDRHRRTVFPAVTELRRHEAIVGGGETGRWRVRYAGLQLITAGPTDRTRDHRARPRTRRRAADRRAAHPVHGEALQQRHPQPWRPRGREPGQSAFADKLPLDFGQRREDAEHEAAGRIARRVRSFLATLPPV